MSNNKKRNKKNITLSIPMHLYEHLQADWKANNCDEEGKILEGKQFFGPYVARMFMDSLDSILEFQANESKLIARIAVLESEKSVLENAANQEVAERKGSPKKKKLNWNRIALVVLAILLVIAIAWGTGKNSRLKEYEIG